jgi:hypothetical protein
MLRTIWPLVLAVCACLGSTALKAQVPVFITGSAGASLDVDSSDPVTGGGFCYLAGIGLRLTRVHFGGEIASHGLGHSRTARQLGAFARLPAMTRGPVRPYLVVGVADYRYDANSVPHRGALGGSIGAGAEFAVLSRHAGLVLEARFHTAFDKIGTISTQDFLSIGLGLDFGL